MARRKDEEEKYLDVNASMQGSLVFSDPVNLRINGNFQGDLKTRGKLVVGEDAKVSADIEGEEIVVAGIIKGAIKASKIIRMTATAKVSGDIVTPCISMDEGAVLNGKLKMHSQKFTLPELSEYLAVDPSKIIEWVEDGKLSAYQDKNDFIFDRTEVELWVSKNR